jgi:SOS-response transcriptional repressor LexA
MGRAIDKTLSQAKLKLLRAIGKMIDESGMSPSIRELRSELGAASTNTVSETLSRLRRDGFVMPQLTRQAERTIVLTKMGKLALNPDGIRVVETGSGQLLKQVYWSEDDD